VEIHFNHHRPARRRKRRHNALIAVLAVLIGLSWLAEHLIVLAGVALLTGGAFYLGRLHDRRRARPGQAAPLPSRSQPGTPLPSAVPAATLPHADYDRDDEPGTRQPASVPAGSDRARLLADPRLGAHPLRRQS
jgi:hypothetical protein